MNNLDRSLQQFQAAEQARSSIEGWLREFEAALSSQDADKIGKLFHEDCHWRDVLAFTWYYTALRGRDSIASSLAHQQKRTLAREFHLPYGRTQPRLVTRVGMQCIEGIFEFETADGHGSGIIRLTSGVEGSDQPRAWHLSTTLQSLRGHEEKIGKNRPTGSAYSRNFGGDNWEEVRKKAQDYDGRDPAVLVIGGAQAGLSIAARLNQLGVDTLVVEKWPRIGDSWRKRYHSLALHNSVELNHLPYLEFPPTFPTYIPKDMLGNWFEFYVDAMEINCWTNTEFVAGSWDNQAKRWIATLRRSDGSERVLKPRHLVFANGVSSYPFIPDVPGLSEFRGEVIHSEGFTSGAGWKGKKALILGTGSSANDIALDLHSHNVDTTLIQRGSTTVVSILPSARLNEALYHEGIPLEDSDLLGSSTTPTLQLQGYKLVVKRMRDHDKELHEGLRKIGFKLDFGEDETGHQMKYYRRGGGYNLDAGSSALMAKGEIGLLQYDLIERFVATGALLKNGKIVPADIIVLATGYFPQIELVKRTLGEEVAKRIGPVWGIGPNGDLNNMYKRTPQQNLWFIAGGLAPCRINSKYLAIQIKATELGLLGPLNDCRSSEELASSNSSPA